MGIAFLVVGIVGWINNISRRNELKAWLVFGALIVSMKFGGLLSVLGILVGISFLFSGVNLIAFGSSLHKEKNV